jgi:hypothetical protein
MSHRASIRRSFLIAALASLAAGTSARGQAILIGVDSPPAGPAPVAGVETVIDLAGAAQAGATLTTASFGWSAGPCPAAVKVKFFRPGTGTVPPLGTPIDLVAERGPFDVPLPADFPLPFPNALVTRTVSLFPPVTVQPGDRIGLAVLTSCGGPTLAGSNPPAPALPGAIWFSGDVGATVFFSQAVRQTAPVFVTASAASSTLTLLKDRFTVFLSARDPRTNIVAIGNAVKLGDGSGYFSLPEFTGDATIPEVMVKMVDATGAPALGGNFWFFYAPLTDTRFLITVVDEKTGTPRTYSSQTNASGSGVFCGEADTSAFVP